MRHGIAVVYLFLPTLSFVTDRLSDGSPYPSAAFWFRGSGGARCWTHSGFPFMAAVTSRCS